jgi:hypothetical protein
MNKVEIKEVNSTNVYLVNNVTFAEFSTGITEIRNYIDSR